MVLQNIYHIIMTKKNIPCDVRHLITSQPDYTGRRGSRYDFLEYLRTRPHLHIQDVKIPRGVDLETSISDKIESDATKKLSLLRMPERIEESEKVDQDLSDSKRPEEQSESQFTPTNLEELLQDILELLQSRLERISRRGGM